MTYPILEYDPDPRALIEASSIHSPGAVPERAVLCFFPEVFEKVGAALGRECARIHSERGPQAVYEVAVGDERVAVLHPGVGAPAAAICLETAIALGSSCFVSCGGAGALTPDLTLGQVIVPVAATRGEGTSYHYLPPDREVTLDAAILSAVERFLNSEGIPFVRGKTWTTDALFRETRGLIERRRSEGCISVEMEVAALLAVARFRRVTLACLLYAGDSVATSDWEHRAWWTANARETLFWMAARTCLSLPSDGLGLGRKSSSV